MNKSKSIHTNKLSKEKSPYLFQYADNPVNWYPWGEEAFRKAKRENKPILLSIGYSTCHWCHVMREVSYSNLQTAEIINKHFVAINVDREERPDLDSLYMNVVRTFAGRGGWPLTIFLTPDKKPFYGGTFFTPEDEVGTQGLKTILLYIVEEWRKDFKKISLSADNLIAALKESLKKKTREKISFEEIFRKSYVYFEKTFDFTYGGFGRAPKFPNPHNFLFLLRYWKQAKEAFALEIVEKSLSNMAKGAICDQLGGGFHRYSTDSMWKIPHFEKMLYDQALIAQVYLELYQITGKEEYAASAAETLDFVLREMTDKCGGFYSAFDADSPDPHNHKRGGEGLFYLWKKKEIIDALGEKDGEIFCCYFGVKEEGNIGKGYSGELKEKNILFCEHNLQELAEKFNLSIAEADKTIRRARKKLLDVRSKRTGPYLDDKILVDWNGLVISSLASASKVLNQPHFGRAAEKCTQFILKELKDKRGDLFHRYRKGEKKVRGMLDDYAFFIQGLIDLYQVTFKPQYFKEAKKLCKKMIDLFWDDKEGGFFLTSQKAEELFLRPKEIYDSALPSGNSIAILDLIKLSRMTFDKELEEKAKYFLDNFSSDIAHLPSAHTQLLVVLEFAFFPSREIIIAGDMKFLDTLQMVNYLYKLFIPNKVMLLRPRGGGDLREMLKIAPFLKEYKQIEGKTTVYICENRVCKKPITAMEELRRIFE